jgi:oxalate decarboxylase/phosphoglucose isomerase-like protein (cupin superfamily)
MDFHDDDVGYIERSMPHHIENPGDRDLVFLEVFPAPEYSGCSLARWLAHTPSRLVEQACRYRRGLSAQNRPKGNSYYARIIAIELS